MLAQIRGKTTDTTAFRLVGNLQHPLEQAFRAFSGATAQMAFATLRADEFPRTRHAKALCRRLMRFQLELRHGLLSPSMATPQVDPCGVYIDDLRFVLTSPIAFA